MCTNTHIKHRCRPSHSVHVRVKYVRCVLEVSDNLSETHAVLFSCTLSSALFCLIYSSPPLCPLTSLSALLPNSAVTSLSSSIIPLFLCFFSLSVWDCKACMVSALPLAAQCRSPPAFSPCVQILKSSATQFVLCFFHQ